MIVESGGLTLFQRNTCSPANAKFPSLALRGFKTKNPAQVNLAGFLSFNPLRNFAFDRGVGRNDQNFTVSMFMRHHTDFEKRGHRIGDALTKFNILKIFSFSKCR